MRTPKELDERADTLLDQHRTKPAGARLLAGLRGGEAPDPHMAERLRAQQRRFQAVSKLFAAVTIVGVILLCLIAVGLLSAF